MFPSKNTSSASATLSPRFAYSPKDRYLNIPNRQFVGKTVSGYYEADCYDQIWDAIKFFDGKAEIYCTIHQPDEALLARYNNRLQFNAKHTTGDSNIISFTTFPFDIDPQRPTDISSTDEQLKNAQHAIAPIADLFKELGLPAPLKALSGNGYHLHQLIEPLSVNEENTLRFKELGDTMALIADDLLRDADLGCNLECDCISSCPYFQNSTARSLARGITPKTVRIGRAKYGYLKPWSA